MITARHARVVSFKLHPIDTCSSSRNAQLHWGFAKGCRFEYEVYIPQLRHLKNSLTAVPSCPAFAMPSGDDLTIWLVQAAASASALEQRPTSSLNPYAGSFEPSQPSSSTSTNGTANGSHMDNLVSQWRQIAKQTGTHVLSVLLYLFTEVLQTCWAHLYLTSYMYM